MRDEAVKTHMNAHFVFNSLNAIQHFITENEKELSLKYLSMFGKLIRYHLENIGRESVPVGLEFEMIGLYLKLQKLRYGDKFEYNLSVEDLFGCNTSLIPGNLMGGLFENILENEIMYSSQPVSLQIDINILEKGVRLEIQYTNENMGNQSRKNHYREGFMKWEDQVKLINKVKNVYIGKNSLISVETMSEVQMAMIKLYIPFQKAIT